MKLTTAAAAAGILFTPVSVALKAREYTATFDENEPNSGFYGVNITGSYDDLHYTNWFSGPFDFQAGFCAYVCPVSFPVEAAFRGGKGKSASISASYANSTVQSFSLRDTYFGCNAQLTGFYEGQSLNLTSPGNCSLTVTGHLDKNLPAIASQTFQYRPEITQNPNSGAPSALMTHVVFNPAFQQPGIRYVVWSATGPTTDFVFGATLNASAPTVLVDNLHYFTYSTR